MSSSTSIPVKESDVTAPTPQNTPLNAAPITLGLSRPTVPAIEEERGDDDDEPEEAIAPGAAGILSSIAQRKLQALVGQSSGYVENLPTPAKRSVEALKGVQHKSNELFAQYKKECLELEKKYLALQQPIFDRRKEIIAGSAAPTVEEIALGEKVSAEDEEDYKPLSPVEGEPEATPIPEFWLTALRNHMELAEIITDSDAELLKHLVDIRLSYLPADAPAPGYKLTFVFEKNDWFENEVLEKTYYYQSEVGYLGDFIYERAEGTEIKWKSDEKDLTKVIEVKKQRNKNTQRTRLVKKTRPADSFFNFFSPPVPPSDDDEEEMSENALNDLEMKLEVDYQIGEDFKEKIIPRAVDYFTGKALAYEGPDSDDDDFEDYDEDSDEDDESDDEPPTARRRGKGRGGNNQNPDPAECKQQ